MTRPNEKRLATNPVSVAVAIPASRGPDDLYWVVSHPLRAMRIVALLLLTITPMVFSGCMPLHGLKAFGASGTVVDARTREPISDVTVRVSGQKPVLTAKDGSFVVREQREWFIFVLGLPNELTLAVMRPMLTVECVDYQTQSLSLREMIETRHNLGKDGGVRVGTIEITRDSQ